MPIAFPSHTRCSPLTGAAAPILGLLLAAVFSYAHAAPPADQSSATSRTTVDDDSIRPFHIHVPDETLVDLRHRIDATRWPDKETVADQSQGVQEARIQALVQYWGTDYDWRKTEARLNALPMFVTTIDGVDIQFIHVKSRHRNALPLIITHGWPGSPLELEKAIGPLTDPTAYGGRAGDAFDVVIPAMPGYGFSGKPTGTGWDPDHIARAWDVLMKRLGYKQYVSQGGDWGSVVADAMGRQAPVGLLGIHVNMPATVPPDVAKALNHGEPAPAGLSDAEKAAYASLADLYKKGAGYAAMMVTRPQTEGYGLADSPAGQAAWMYDKFAAWTDSGGDPERALTKDQMLDDITLYWVTNTSTSSARLYWENNNNNFNAAEQQTAEISVPVAVTVFPGEIYRAPRSWAERSYRKLSYFHEVNKGGHFAAWEQPQLFAEELRAAFRPLRRHA
ncbi:epoxide hydrolase family protein [Paraburkholderia sp. BL21I4N1]|uniref:epoxide hydrolase family protein n=1 Tax=Paraburkholderia sp. BL21I4N1 TaxID=1938801 RepID=UPI000CFE0DA3|nr:epoxide hydrolase family protein [Paraburkholderia sp. BL21I4N1]PQV46047.1 pimeloyl-ACP methyl ester carboxylesterase [Paraburkholderia sp. BL21I4N1]